MHFVYKSHTLSQLTSPEFTHPYTTKSAQERLFQTYQQVQHRMYHLTETQHITNDIKPHSVYYHRSDTETVIGWHMTEQFDLFAIFSPLVTKISAIKGCNMLLKWVRQEEDNLFILTSPVWGK